jgi:uncharacterized membrane protein YgcG
MKTRLTLLVLIAAALLSTGCMTTARRNTAMAASQYGADATVVAKLERGRQLSLTDLEELGRRGVSDTLILAHLRRRADTYRLTAAQVIGLREAGLGERVITYLLESRERVARPARRGSPIYSHRYHGGSGHYSGGFGHGGFGHGGGRRGGRH